MSKRRLIKWVKWKNFLFDGFKRAKPSDEDDESYKDSYEQMEDAIAHGASDLGPVLMSPFGNTPLIEHNDISKVFDFYVGHCNFRITPEIRNIIDNTEGVETLEVWTPYRFRIAVGKAFNPRAVRKKIVRSIQPKKESVLRRATHYDVLETISTAIAEKYVNWAICTTKFGDYEIVSGATLEDAKRDISRRGLIPILTSWNGTDGSNESGVAGTNQ
jgi:hypothetical protein